MDMGCSSPEYEGRRLTLKVVQVPLEYLGIRIKGYEDHPLSYLTFLSSLVMHSCLKRINLAHLFKIIFLLLFFLFF